MSLSIVMYHYVRDLARSRYPAIKGRDLVAFRGQLDYLARHHTVVTAEQVVAAVKDREPLPDNAAWLTFDDGYSDHYSTVFPLLHERGWQGSFFPPAVTVLDGELLDVNRIHFILAAQPDTRPVLAAIRGFVEERRHAGAVRPFDEYWGELAQASRFDPAEVVFIKRILQFGLPEDLRTELARSLFERFVSVDPAAFAAELYMTPEQLRTMLRCGMYIGSHGARHYWLDRLDPSRQAGEIDAALDFLRALGAPTEDWVMCYPYGAYNDTLLPVLKERGCAAGLTTRVAVARPGVDDALALPRLDTNDLPIRMTP
jgi:peptidoglycan/xylan/chitin deacetylase (PgdA/CDA1 family)